MDPLDPLEARTQRLHQLRTNDPVAWAICQGTRGVTTIAARLQLSPQRVETELLRLVKAKEIKRVRYYNSFAYRPLSREMKRLARRAHTLSRENDG